MSSRAADGNSEFNPIESEFFYSSGFEALDPWLIPSETIFHNRNGLYRTSRRDADAYPSVGPIAPFRT